MGRGIVVLLVMSALCLVGNEELTSVIHCETAAAHFTGVTPDCVPVGVY